MSTKEIMFKPGATRQSVLVPKNELGERMLHTKLKTKQADMTAAVSKVRDSTSAVRGDSALSAYEHLSRSALVGLLQEHDAALLDAGRDGIVMSYTGRTAPWQIIRLVKPKLSRIIKKLSIGDEKRGGLVNLNRAISGVST